MKRVTKRRPKKAFKLGVPDWQDANLDPKERGLASYSDFEDLVDASYSKDNIRIQWYSLYNAVQVYEPGYGSAIGDTLYSRLARASYEDACTTINVIGILVDSVHAEITKAKNRIKFMTNGGDPMAQKKALQLTAYLDGTFTDEELWSKAGRAYKDALTDVYGCLKYQINPEKGKIEIEYVPSRNVYVPNYQTTITDPVEVFEVHEMTLEQLYDKFPDQLTEWFEAQGTKKIKELDEDVFLVVERWRAKTAGRVGARSISWKHGELFFEEWPLEFVPWTFCWWSRDPAGFHGTNIVQKLGAIQADMNRLLSRYMLSIKENALTRWFIKDNSGVQEDELNAEFNTIIHGNEPPVQMVPQKVLPGEVMEAILLLYSKAYETIGMSQLNAAGIKPAGIDSGAAQREYRETVSTRFNGNEDLYSDMFIRAAKIIVSLTKIMSASDQELLVKLVSKKANVAKIAWKDIDLDEDRYVLSAYNASFLPTQPSGRVQFANELIQLGMPKEDAFMLLELPDNDAYLSMQTASTRAAQAVVDRMVQSREMDDMDPAVNPDIARRYIDYRICQELENPEPERDVIDLLNSLKSALPQPPMPAMPMAAGAPGLPGPDGAPMEPSPNGPQGTGVPV